MTTIATGFYCNVCDEADTGLPVCPHCEHDYTCENCGFNDIERNNNCPRCNYCTGCNRPYEVCDMGRWYAEKEAEEAKKPDCTFCLSCKEALYTQDDVLTHVCKTVEPYEPEF